jgi:hypothetical protein
MTAVVDKAELFFPLSGLVNVEQTLKKLNTLSITNYKKK